MGKLSKLAPREIPADFVKVREQVRSIRNLMRHYDAGPRTVRRWLTEIGAEHKPRPERPECRRPVPEDFAELAPTMTKTGLSEHYGTANKIVERWCAETGISAKRRQPRKRNVFTMPSNGAPTVERLRNYGIHDEAADVLRHYGPVYRCDEQGRAKERGELWRVGNVVVDGDELMARADRARRKAA